MLSFKKKREPIKASLNLTFKLAVKRFMKSFYVKVGLVGGWVILPKTSRLGCPECIRSIFPLEISKILCIFSDHGGKLKMMQENSENSGNQTFHRLE